MRQKEIERFVESLFDERIWQCDVEYQKAMVRLWIGMAVEEGGKSLKFKVTKVN